MMLVAGEAGGACDSTSWVVDTGAARHATCDRSILHDYREFSVDAAYVELEDVSGGRARASGVGTAVLELGDGDVIRLSEVHFFPTMRYSLLSVQQAIGKGCQVSIDESGIHLGWATAPWVNGVARLSVHPQLPISGTRLAAAAAGSVGAAKQVAEAERLHAALGHASNKTLADAVGSGKVVGVDPLLAPVIKSLPECEACIQAKLSRPPFLESSRKDEWELGQLLHMDVWGPARVPTHEGCRFFVSATDQCGRLSLVELLASKDGALEFAKAAVKRFELVTGNPTKAVRFDGGGEFVNRAMKEFCRQRGTHWEKTTPYSSQQNGLAEKLNRDLMEMVRANLIAAGLDHKWWGLALGVSVYQKNRLPHSALPGKVSPWQHTFGKPPDVSGMQEFGTRVYVVKLPRHASGAGKLGAVTVRGKFVGYSPNSKAYLVLLDAEYRRTKAVVESRDVKFLNGAGARTGAGVEQPAAPAPGAPGLVVISDSDDEEEQLPGDGAAAAAPGDGAAAEEQQQPGDGAAAAPPEDATAAAEPGEGEVAALRRSARQRSAPARYAAAGAVGVSVSRVAEPRNTKEARNSPEAEAWKKAEAEELQSMIDNGVMFAATLPKGKRAIKTRFVYKAKYDQLGVLVRYKARMVALGFVQIEGQDYTDVFAPVGRLSSLRALLALAAKWELAVHQMDVKTAFLQAELQEDVYVTLPTEVQSGGDPVVYKLDKAIYGLKQSPRAWYDKLRLELEGFEFVATTADTALFIRRGKYDDTYILCHVDDMLVVGSPEAVSAAKEQVKSVFEVTDLGEVTYHLGMEVTRDWEKGTISLSQCKYTAELLDRFGMTDSRPVGTPAEPKTKLQAAVGAPLGAGGISLYREQVGSMMYLASCTRPDIAQAVGALARFMSAPTAVHERAVKHLLRYVSGTRTLGIVYGGDQPEQPIGYSDSDWAGDLDNRRSTGAFVFNMSGGIVSWKAQLQKTVATSTQAAEYMAAGAAAREAIWLRQLCDELGVKVTRMVIKGDNTAAISLASNPMVQDRSKHIDVQHHFIRERVMSGEIEFSYIPTTLMVADSLTKAVDAPKVIFCREGMGLRPVRI